MKGDIRYHIYIGGKPHEGLTRDAAEITVTEAMQDASTCVVKFAIDLCNGDYEHLDSGELIPGKDQMLSVVAWIDGTQTVIFHGPITGRKVELKHGGPGSSLEVSATDRRVQLDRKCRKFKTWSGTVDFIVGSILTEHKFASQKVESFSKLRFSPESSTLNQSISDLALIKKLGATVSAEFWIDWTLAGGRIVETAHFSTQPKRNDSKGGGFGLSLPIDQPKKPSLRLNTGDPKSTLLSFSSERKTEVPQQSGTIMRIDPRTGEIKSTRVDQPSTKPLGKKPETPKVECEVVTAGSVEEARQTTEAAINDASWLVEAKAETTVYSLCGLLRPRFVVDVNGTGKQDDGEYLVWAVDHQITPAEHRMRLTLRRNAQGGK
jgi:hypothetical protein